MNRMLVVAGILSAVIAGAWVGAHSARVSAASQPAPLEAPVGAALLPGLGNYDFKITTRNPEVQRWFNQGLMLTFGFNHDAAERSFLEGSATRSRLRDVLVGSRAGARTARQRTDGPGR